jgi:ferredoxin-NADP reductase
MSSAPEKPLTRPEYRARVERIQDHAADLRSLFLRCIDRPVPAFLPGMFISITMPLAAEIRTRPYTIASAPEAAEPFEIVFNLVPGGAGSQWLFERKLGDQFNFTGPFGTFTIDRPPTASTVFIAEGTGIAAIRPMLHRVLGAAATEPVALVYIADHPEHLLYRAELEGLAERHSRFHCEIAGEAGSAWDFIRETVRRRWIDGDSDRSRQFYICGVGAGVIKTSDLLRGAGYERRVVHYEKW